MSNPVRIYVLYHPKSRHGKVLTDSIYDWFRGANQEGIPVYVRSDPAEGKSVPNEPIGKDESLEYLLPLVDAHMVRDVAWHEYLASLAKQCLQDESNATKGWVMFPVAIDGTSFNLPNVITRRNFVRFNAEAKHSDVNTQEPTFEQATAGLRKDLTEALSRDLNARLFPQQAGRKLKIFISYARGRNKNRLGIPDLSLEETQ